MREIKFRGKRVDGLGWVYGFLFKSWERYLILWGMKNSVPDATEVIAETVGQYIGLHDKESNKLHEGDIVKIFTDKWIIAVVRIEYGIPIFTSVDFADTYEYVSEYLQYDGGYGWVDCELIGNIRDNPELTEERRDSNE
jgi:uncharacterized phage protein (TIGR01671 family)